MYPSGQHVSHPFSSLKHMTNPSRPTKPNKDFNPTSQRKHSRRTLQIEFSRIPKLMHQHPIPLTDTSPPTSPSTSPIKLQRQHQKRDISHDAQASQHDDDIAAGAETFPAQPIVADFAEKLPVALHAAEGADAEDAGAVDGEEGACVLDGACCQ